MCGCSPQLGGTGAVIQMSGRLGRRPLRLALGNNQAPVRQDLGGALQPVDRLTHPARKISSACKSHDFIKGRRTNGNFALSPGGDHGIGLVYLEAALTVFDALALPIIMFDREGRVVAVSRATTHILDDDLRIAGRQLLSSSDQATTRFERALQQVVRSTEPATRSITANSSVALCVFPRENGRPVATCLSRLDILGSPAVAIVRFMDLNQRPASLDIALAQSLGLSPCEARLAVALCSGYALSSVAGLLGITYETARSRLKIVFAKTGTRRQGELVALLVHAGGVLPPGASLAPVD